MKALIVTPDRDRDRGDWSGAFAVEASRLVQLHQLVPNAVRLSINIDRSARDQRWQLQKALAEHDQLAFVAILCHGWRVGLQIGWRLDWDHLGGGVEDLARALGAAAAPNLVIMLYACSTQKDAEDRPGTAGDGGFADALRDALCRVRPDWRGWVDGHTRAGHCCRNPYVRRMEGPACSETGACEGGDWLVAPGSPAWPDWDQALHDPAQNLRLRFPLMTRAEILAELAMGRGEASRGEASHRKVS